MKKLKSYFLLLLFSILFVCNPVQADVYSKAENLIKKAQNASIKEESYEYINSARLLYKEKYEKNPTDIRALVGLSKVHQLTGERREAKLYVLKAYNMKPYDPKLQREMGDFYYSFQEYSTAIEYYKLALASGLLRDFETNLITAKCYEKLGDLENAELYYQICNHLNPNSKRVSNKLNHYESKKHEDNSQELEDAKYKYLFKKKKLTESEQNEVDAESIIEKLNNSF
ncbi:hypothetical protein IJD44_01760 [bacterium]|nr:hypothetical protein [bacterium]